MLESDASPRRCAVPPLLATIAPMLRSSSRSRHALAVMFLCLAFFLQSLFASLEKSPVFDEPVHIVSGAAYVATRTIGANLQHPPLVKELAGISLAAAGIRWQGGIGQQPGWEWDAANAFVEIPGVARTLFWARLPMILLSPFFALLVYGFGRQLFGPSAALGALFLFAADPTMVAHSYLVTTDAAVAAASLLFLLALYRYLLKPGNGRLLFASVALGLALSTKFSAVFLIPIAAILLFCGAPRLAPPRSPMVFAFRALGVMGLVSLAIIVALYLSWRAPYLYLLGMHRVNGDHVAGFLCYLGGELKSRFYSYFAMAWLLKEPLATVALALTGVVLATRRRGMKRLVKLFFFVPPVIFFLACTFLADDLGVRYEMPVMLFGYLAGGIALETLWRGRIYARVAALAACAWVVLAAAGIYPDHLSYFNEAACLPDRADRIGFDGGSRCGPEWLADSNVDWGQSLPQLKSWIDRHAGGRPVNLLYFGYSPPEAYGIPNDPNARMVPLPPRGLYAISSHFVAYGLANPRLEWLREKPAAVVGHAYYIYDIEY